METPRNRVRRQLALEAESRQLGKARYDKSRPLPWKQQASKAREEADLPPGRQMLKLLVEPVAESLRNKITSAEDGKASKGARYVKWLALAGAEEIAYITARTALNLTAEQGLPNFQTVAIAVATNIMDHVAFAIEAAANPARYRGLIKGGRKTRRWMQLIRKVLSQAQEGETELVVGEKLGLGTAALEALTEVTGFFERVRRHNKPYGLALTADAKAWLNKQHYRASLMMPLKLPMVVRPRRWRNPTTGGYLRPGKDWLISGRGGRRSKVPLYKEAEMAKAYAALNALQDTPWRVNKQLLKAMRQAWDEGATIAGLPAREDKPLPGKPEGYGLMAHDDPARIAWRRAAAAIFDDNATLTAKRDRVGKRLWVAERFADEDAIYFPHSLDFRGRAYPMPESFNPHGEDGDKALLEFAEGKPLGAWGPYWLAIHVANTFGIDKVSMADRVAWTEEHSDRILEAAGEPLNAHEFWGTAEKPWQALAACFEWAGFKEHGSEFVSHLSIALDGSNSGLQHFSGLMLDAVGAAKVSLLPAETPADIYAEVAAVVQATVNTSSDPFAAPWKPDKVSRKVAKKPTMTYVYSVTRLTMAEQITDAVAELDENGPYLRGAANRDAAWFLSGIMAGKDGIAKLVPAAAEGMRYLKAIAGAATKANRKVTWTAPDGFPIEMDYQRREEQRFKVHWMGQPMELIAWIHSEGQRDTQSAISSNFIHSMDGAHLREATRVAAGAGITALATNHDSFGTHAANTQLLRAILLDTFAKQYEAADWLRVLRDEQDDPTLPMPPGRGTLDLAGVRRAPFAFS